MNEAIVTPAELAKRHGVSAAVLSYRAKITQIGETTEIGGVEYQRGEQANGRPGWILAGAQAPAFTAPTDEAELTAPDDDHDHDGDDHDDHDGDDGRPQPLPVLAENIPESLKASARWVLWRYEQRAPGGKWTKPPRTPGGKLASVTDPGTWSSFATAEEAYRAGKWDGIGFVLSDDLAGLDLDHVLDAAGRMEPWAADIVREFAETYREFSPSGDGIRILAKGTAPFTGKRGPENRLECYAAGSPRYLTITGQSLNSVRAVKDSPAALAWLGQRFDTKADKPAPVSQPAPTAKAPSSVANAGEVIEAIRKSKAGAKFTALYEGGGKGDDNSADDMALLNLCSFFTVDPDILDSIMRSSALYRPKWDERRGKQTYGERTIAEALASASASAGEARRADGDSGGTPAAARASSASGNGPQEKQEEAGDWPAPHPITAKVPPEPYPIDALPVAIREAVAEVHAFVKAPLPIVAQSALAALSLAGQGLVDVKRAERLLGPVSMFMLTIADSGERKTTCDGFFSTPIKEYESEQAAMAKPDVERYRADYAAWQAEKDGVLSAIKGMAKAGKSTAGLRRQLEELQADEPKPPRIPRLLLGDETPESLAWRLAHEWPSAGIVSSEAGTVFGGHGMGSDSAMRNLSLLNVLWDGGTHSVGRRTSQSFTVKGARLTTSLMIQEPTLRAFFERDGGLARGSGFLARFLVAWPESTQGTRLFSEAPANWPHLSAFHRRLADILATSPAITDEGELTTLIMELSPQAKEAWMGFHDDVERLLVSGAPLYDVRDVASKAADNAARLAALFQMFATGSSSPVAKESFDSAAAIVEWHLTESRRFFGELALPPELAGAARLDTWLLDHCRKGRTLTVAKSHALQYGPLRKAADLDAAIKALYELERVRVKADGKRYMLTINPALMGAKP